MNTLKAISTAILMLTCMVGYAQNASQKKAIKNIENVYKKLPGAFDKITYEDGILTIIYYQYSKESIDLNNIKAFEVFPYSEPSLYRVNYSTKQNQNEWKFFTSFEKEGDAEKVRDQLNIIIQNL